MEERSDSFAQSPKHKAVSRRSPGIILHINVLFLSTKQLKASLIVRQNKVTVVAVVKKKKHSKLKSICTWLNVNQDYSLQNI